MSNVKGFTNTQKIKEEAASWLLAIEQKSPLTAEEAQALRDWVATSDVHRSVIIRMARTWENMNILAVMRASPERKSVRLRRFTKVVSGLRYLKRRLTQNHMSNPPRQSLFFKYSMVFTCFIFSVIVINYYKKDALNTLHNQYVTTIGEYGKHTLEDGSKLWLNSNSQVQVDYSDTLRRIILTKGEAHFQVEKDSTRPFEVYSMNRLVRAVGTAFSVHKVEDRVEVTVSEGVVELAVIDKALVLNPDDLLSSKDVQHAKKAKENKSFLRSMSDSTYLGQLKAGQSMSIPNISSARIEGDDNLVVQLDPGEMSRKLSWLNGKLVFAGETLEEVVTEISRHTTIKIEVPDPELRKLRIGGHFQAGETDKLFAILESGFGIEVVEINEDHVELSTRSEKFGKVVN